MKKCQFYCIIYHRKEVIVLSALSELIEVICGMSDIGICIHDVSGILGCEELEIKKENRVHSFPYCDAAKTTRAGYDACIECKTLSNERAAESGLPFSRYCTAGIFEVVYPVIIEKNVYCIIYVGNISLDRTMTEKIARLRSSETRIDEKKLTSLIGTLEYGNSCDFYARVAKTVADCITVTALATGCHERVKKRAANYAVAGALEYIECNLDKKLTLKSIAALYYTNEKYLGKLFTREVGESFNRYVDSLRLKKACKLLRATKKSVIEISLEVGFTNVTYFGRRFREKYGVTPTEARKNPKVLEKN